jgi:hypothetical protein
MFGQWLPYGNLRRYGGRDPARAILEESQEVVLIKFLQKCFANPNVKSVADYF